jgi:hypothetical protein
MPYSVNQTISPLYGDIISIFRVDDGLYRTPFLVIQAALKLKRQFYSKFSDKRVRYLIDDQIRSNDSELEAWCNEESASIIRCEFCATELFGSVFIENNHIFCSQTCLSKDARLREREVDDDCLF